MSEQTTAAADTATTVATAAATDTTAAATTASGATTTASLVEAGKATDTKTADTTAATLAAGTDKDGKPTSDFPADWRERMAGEDKALLTRLQRLTDPTQLGKTIREQDKEISKRAPAPIKPADDATPEQVAEYRKAAGLPLAAEDYVANLKMPDGRTLGDGDKEIALEFAKTVAMSGASLTQEQYNAAWGYYARSVERAADDLAQQDMDFKLKAEDSLRQSLGADFRPSINAIGTLFDGAPAGMRDRFLGGRLADGRKLGDDPEALIWLSSMARQLNPLASITPSQGQTQSQTVDSRITAIEKMMRDDYNGYMRDNAVQKEYRDLLIAKQQTTRNGRAA